MNIKSRTFLLSYIILFVLVIEFFACVIISESVALIVESTRLNKPHNVPLAIGMQSITISTFLIFLYASVTYFRFFHGTIVRVNLRRLLLYFILLLLPYLLAFIVAFIVLLINYFADLETVIRFAALFTAGSAIITISYSVIFDAIAPWMIGGMLLCSLSKDSKRTTRYCLIKYLRKSWIIVLWMFLAIALALIIRSFIAMLLLRIFPILSQPIIQIGFSIDKLWIHKWINLIFLERMPRYINLIVDPIYTLVLVFIYIWRIEEYLK